jgi:N-acetylglucosaminyldiphosphoundecaprenol N-acetyl-beta-D-mannosaminyltransferase
VPTTNRADQYRTVTAAGVPATKVLDVPVSTINMPVAVAIILDWIRNRNAQFVCVRDVHGLMRAHEDPELLALHNLAGLITPDGMPLVWLTRRRGYKTASRVCGFDLVAALTDASQSIGARHYFFGGKPGIAEVMAAKLKASYPGIEIAGCYTPPFRPLSEAEDRECTERLARARPDIVWVGISTPKQEFWMRDHVGRIPGATLIGVGAAFDFYAGAVTRAPRWMQRYGLEWLHRLISEPRRLWRRYLVMAPKFLALVLLGRLRAGLRKG